MDENINLTILNEIAKATKMGMSSINFVSDKITDEIMKENLSTQYAEYGKILNKVNTEFEKYGEIPDDEPIGAKMMSWTGVQMNTMMDKSNSHIADMLIQGTTMGIIEGRKLLNQNPNIDTEVRQVLDTFVKMQENNVEQLKTFL